METGKATGAAVLRRRGPVVLALCIGAALSIASFLAVRRAESHKIQTALDYVARDYASLVTRALEELLLVSEAIQRFYDGSEYVSRQEFREFVDPFLRRMVSVQALVWAPRVSQEERGAYERGAVEAGMGDFGFTERGADGALARAGVREAYFPLYYVEPLEENRSLAGFDLASEPACLEALERVQDSAGIAVTTRVSPPSAREGGSTLLALFPVYAKDEAGAEPAGRRIDGCAGGFFRIGAIVESSIHALRPAAVQVYLTDRSEAPPERLLYVHRCHAAGPHPAAPSTSIAVDVGTLQWSLSVAAAPQFVAERSTAQSWMALAGGLLFTGLLGTYLNHMLGQADRTQRLVDERTRSLRQEIAWREAAEQEKNRLQSLLKNTIDSMPSVLVGVDPEGSVIQWNWKAETLTGITSEEAQGQTLSQVLPQLVGQLDKVREAIRSRQTQEESKVPRSRDGETRYEDVTVYPLIANGVSGAVIRIDDVTDRVRIEEMMVQTEKMMSVGGLAAGMAHEINNPLGVMMQSAQNILRRVSPDLKANVQAAEACGTTLEAVRRYLAKREILDFIEDIRQDGGRAARIVGNMLQFSRRSGGAMQRTSLPKLIDRTLELAANDYDLKKKFDFRHIEIVRQYDPSLPELPLNSTEIEQVILNLLKNGAQAMAEQVAPGSQPEGGAGKRPCFHLRLLREGNWARIEVEDSGPGMSEAVRKRIFEPFFTTKPAGSGTGLGLSVSYMIVTSNHRGTMAVESVAGKGSTFVIRLPLKTETGTSGQEG